MSSQQWVNSFATIDNTHMMDNSTDIDQLFNKKEEDINVVRMLELKGGIISLMNGNDEFDLTEDEQTTLDEIKGSKETTDEIQTLMDKIEFHIEIFHKIQTELNKYNDDYQKEVQKLKKNVSTTESMIEFIKKIPEEQKDHENIKNIIEQMNILTKTIMDNEKIKNIRKLYLEKRKEFEKSLELIKKINHLNQTNLCSVCFANPVDHFTEPCGHTFCKECIKTHLRKNEGLDLYEVGRVDNAQCCFCRERIKTVRPLYFL